jgi:hypothetical protein
MACTLIERQHHTHACHELDLPRSKKIAVCRRRKAGTHFQLFLLSTLRQRTISAINYLQIPNSKNIPGIGNSQIASIFNKIKTIHPPRLPIKKPATASGARRIRTADPLLAKQVL